MKLMTKAIEAAMPAMRSTEKLSEDKTNIAVKFFTPDAGATWYVLEGEKLEDGDWEFFGFVNLGDPQMAELGYFRLSELESVRGPFGLKIERDRLFEATMADVRRQM